MAGTLSNIYNNTTFALNLHTEAMARLQEQAYTGSRINQSSDAPSEAYQVLSLNAQKKNLNNYVNNISETIGMLEISTEIIGGMQELIANSLTETTKIISGTYTQSGRDIAAESINTMLEDMVSKANTQHAGKYIFGGSDTTSPPYVVQRTNGQITSVTYQGSSQSRDMEAASGVQVTAYYAGEELFHCNDRETPVFYGDTGSAVGSGTASVKGDNWLTVAVNGASYDLTLDGGTTVNVAAAVGAGADITNIPVTNTAGEILYVDASSITGAGTELVRVSGTYDVFNALISARDILENDQGLSDTQQAPIFNSMSGPLGELKNLLASKQTSIGVRTGFLYKLKDNQSDMVFNVEDQTSRLQDADIAQIAIELSRRSVLYEMSLTIAGRLMSTSLLDYI